MQLLEPGRVLIRARKCQQLLLADAESSSALPYFFVISMCKALDKGTVIREVRLERKSGGKSGDYQRKG